MKKIKIEIISNYFPPELGAASNRIYNLSKGLQDIGYDVEVLCPLPNYPKGRIFEDYRGKLSHKETFKGIKTRRYWIYPTVSEKAFKRLLGMLSFAISLWGVLFHLLKRKPDIIIIQHSPLFVSFSAMILSKCLRRPKRVLNVSDLWPLSAAELGVMKKESLVYRIMEKMERFNYKQSHYTLGQSKEILSHIEQYVDKPKFLYRNISPEYMTNEIEITSSQKEPFKIVYAGLLGVAQGVFNICQNVDFKSREVEFHIFGNGNEQQQIEEFLKTHPNINIFYHGSVSKEELHQRYPSFQAAIVPLANRIYGAVPSKIYELISFGVPILFCGGGEGAQIIDDQNLGYISTPGDYEMLENNITKIKSLSNEEYKELLENCSTFKKNNLDFDYQIQKLHPNLKKII